MDGILLTDSSFEIFDFETYNKKLKQRKSELESLRT